MSVRFQNTILIIIFLILGVIILFAPNWISLTVLSLSLIISASVIHYIFRLMDSRIVALEKFAIVVKKSDNAIAILNAKGEFEWMNEAYIKLHSIDIQFIDSLIGEHITDFSVNNNLKTIIQQCITDKQSVNYETFCESKNGKIWLETTITPIFDDNDKIINLIAIDSDITEIKETDERIKQHEEEIITQNTELQQQKEEILAQAESLLASKQKIEEHQELLYDIFEFLPDAVLVIDKTGNVLAWNKAMERLTGVLAADIEGKGNYEYSLPFYNERRPLLVDLVLNENQEMLTRYSKVERKEDELFNEVFIPHFRGAEGAYLAACASPLYNLKDEIIGAIEIISDITDRKKAEMALETANTKLQEQNQKLHQMNEEIQAQRDEIEKHLITVEKQKEEIEQKRKDILDSIFYAKRIQNAILPSISQISETLPQHLILFKPRDIVSGDYYWIKQKEDKTIVVAADCTGHGVPGAFMSILGTAFLNEIVMKDDIVQANEILNHLRQYVINFLNQAGRLEDARDGMDIALCIINKETMELEFSGAYNPLYLIRNKQLQEYKADKMPIGIYDVYPPFTCKKTTIEKGDNIYIFSDGFQDQFGGPEGKKFMSGRLKRLFIEICDRTMEEQKEILDLTIETWKSHLDVEGNPHEQIDDILVVGIKIE